MTPSSPAGSRTSPAWWPAAAPQLARDNQRLVIGPWDHVNWGRPEFRARAHAQGHRCGRGQPDQRADAGLVRPLPQGRGQRRRRDKPAGGLLRDGCQHVEDGVGVGRCRRHIGRRTTCRGPAACRRPRGTTRYRPRPATRRPTSTPTIRPSRRPSLGGHSCCGARSGPQGPYDQTPVEQRSDVLVYTSAPLTTTPRSPVR